MSTESAPISHWLTPESMNEQLHVLAAFTLVLCGITIWEFACHLPFDLQILAGRRKFQWPMILYFICRWSMVLHVFSFAININTTTEIPCQGVVLLSNVTDMLGTVTSSAILALRSHAIWGRDRRVGGMLLALLCVQIGSWAATFYFTHSVWEPHGNFCRIVTSTPTSLLIACFSFTMTLDFVILALAVYRLWPERGSGGIASLLLKDGMGSFAAAFLANTVQTVLVALRLSSIMNLMCVSFALVVSSIAATTVYRRIVRTPERLAKRREESHRRAGLIPGVSLPQFAPPPSDIGLESATNFGLRGNTTGRTSTLPPLEEWQEGSDDLSDKRPIDDIESAEKGLAHAKIPVRESW